MSDPVYTRSNGVRIRLADMATPHLRSAFFKLQKEDPTHHELPAMADEVRARAIQWRDELKTERETADDARKVEIDDLLAKVAEELSDEA